MAEKDPKEILRETAEELGFIKDQIRSIGADIVESLNDRFDDTLTLAERITAKIKTMSIKDIEKSLMATVKGMDRILSDQIKIVDGSITLKDIIRNQHDIDQKRLLIKQNLDNLEAIGEISAERRTELEIELLDALTKQQVVLDKQKLQQEEIHKNLGVTGKLVKGISKIPILGNLIDSQEVLAKTQTAAATAGATTGKVMKAGFSAIGSSIKTSLTDPLTVSIFLIRQMWLALVETDKITTQLARDFNLSYNEASHLRQSLNGVANTGADINLNTKVLQESLVAIGKSLGSNASINEADLIVFTKLREQAGYTNDELVGIQKLSLTNGKSLEDNTKEILGGAKAYASQKGLMLNEKDILREISKTSATIKISLGLSTDALAKAVVQAKQFGINLQQADGIASSLMDFESSISNEIGAELLTGKMLNLERARGLALNNDIAGASEEILRQVGGTAEFSRMNRIQQEAIAKAVGLSKDELSASLIEREALAKLSGIEGKTAQERYNNLVKEVGVEEAKKRLGNEQLATQYAQQSIADRLTKSTEKLKEVLITIADSLMPVFDILSDILVVVGYIVKPIVGIINAAGQLSSALRPVVALLVAAGAAALFMMGSLTAGLGVAAALAGIGVGMTYLESKTKVKDGIIAPDGGLTVSGEKGTYSLDKNDHIIAGTNLGKPTNNQQQPIAANYDKHFTKMNELLSAIAAKDTNIYQDSTKINTANNIFSYKSLV